MCAHAVLERTPEREMPLHVLHARRIMKTYFDFYWAVFRAHQYRRARHLKKKFGPKNTRDHHQMCILFRFFFFTIPIYSADPQEQSQCFKNRCKAKPSNRIHIGMNANGRMRGEYKKKTYSIFQKIFQAPPFWLFSGNVCVCVCLCMRAHASRSLCECVCSFVLFFHVRPHGTFCINARARANEGELGSLRCIFSVFRLCAMRTVELWRTYSHYMRACVVCAERIKSFH